MYIYIRTQRLDTIPNSRSQLNLKTSVHSECIKVSHVLLCVWLVPPHLITGLFCRV